MKKCIQLAVFLTVSMFLAAPSHALDFVKFGTGHDGGFWGNPDNDLPNFPSTVQYLAQRGKNQLTSVNLNDANVQAAFNGNFGQFQAIVVSESILGEGEPMEMLPTAVTTNAEPLPLSQNSIELLNQFVSNGGCLILTGDHGDGEAPFLNMVFGYNVMAINDNSDPSNIFPIQSGAAGTAFEGGPSQLSAIDLTVTFSNLPGTVIYSGALGEVVSTAQFGSGHVSLLGWDFCCLEEIPATEQQVLAWYEVVNRAFDNCEGVAQIADSVPALSEWGLIAMAALLGIAGLLVVRRRRAAA